MYESAKLMLHLDFGP